MPFKSPAGSKRKIVVLSPGFPWDESDDSCLPYLQDYLLNLKSYGELEMEVIAFQYPFKEKHFSWYGIPVYAASGRNTKGLLRLITWLKVLLHLWRSHRQKNIDVIHSLWLSECTLLGSFFANAFSIPQVASIMGQDALKTNRYLPFLNFERMKIVAGSQFIAGKFNTSAGHQADAVIPLALNISLFPENRSEIQYDVLGVGNLGLIKNYQLFIDVIALLAEKKPGIRAAIIGEGEERQRLMDRIKEKGLENNITLPGNLPRAQVLQLMSRSLFFLHTSKFESQGFVLDEALYSGMKVISTPVADAADCKFIKTGTTERELMERMVDEESEGERVLAGETVRERVTRIEASEAVRRMMEIYTNAG